MRTYLLTFLVALTFSCANNAKKVENEKCSENVSLLKDASKEKKDSSVIRYSFTPDINNGNPVDEATLRRWQQKVIEEADAYYYDQLASYYINNPHLQDEMIKYSEIMVRRKNPNDTYILEFYKYVKQSKTPRKEKLMIKVIKRLKDLSERDEVFFSLMARSKLSELYREGIYLPKDTVIAEYLYKGGGNLDSIIQVRKGK